MIGTILAVVEDLIFLSKIQQTAQLLGVSVEPVDPRKLQERVAEIAVRAFVLDLNHRSGSALEVLRAIRADPTMSRIPLLGFLSHVQTDLAAAARAAGCDILLARSAFTQQLPQLLQKLAGKESAATTSF